MQVVVLSPDRVNPSCAGARDQALEHSRYLALVQRHGEVARVRHHHHPVPGRRGHRLAPRRAAVRLLAPAPVLAGDGLARPLQLVLLRAADGELLAVAEPGAELQLRGAVLQPRHEAGGEAARGGDAPLAGLGADRLLLLPLELHALDTPAQCALGHQSPHAGHTWAQLT